MDLLGFFDVVVVLIREGKEVSLVKEMEIGNNIEFEEINFFFSFLVFFSFSFIGNGIN